MLEPSCATGILIQNMRRGREHQAPKDDHRRAFHPRTLQRLSTLFPERCRHLDPAQHKNHQRRPNLCYHLSEDETTSFVVLKVRLVSPPILALPPHNSILYRQHRCMRPTNKLCTATEVTRRKGPASRVLLANAIFPREKILDNITCVPGRRLSNSVIDTILELDTIRFTIRTDHFAHLFIFDLAEFTELLKHLRLRLLEYKLKVVHLAGIKQQANYALSRLNTSHCDCNILDDNIPVLSIEGLSGLIDYIASFMDYEPETTHMPSLDIIYILLIVESSTLVVVCLGWG